MLFGRRSSYSGAELTYEPPLKRRKRKPFDWSTAFIATVVCSAAVVIYFRDGQAKFLEILTSDFMLFVEILPKVLAACLIAAFVAVLMPREVVLRWVGAESGLLGILIATLAGVAHELFPPRGLAPDEGLGRRRIERVHRAAGLAEELHHVRQGAGHDDGHRIVDVRPLHFVFDIDRVDAVDCGGGTLATIPARLEALLAGEPS